MSQVMSQVIDNSVQNAQDNISNSNNNSNSDSTNDNISDAIESLTDSIADVKITTEQQPIKNKGTGAGGSNTNYLGKKFEEETNNEPWLINNGYVKNAITNNKKANKYNYCYVKQYDDKKITYLTQIGLKTYFSTKYNINLFRSPDEAYIIEYNTGDIVVKILEKKAQTNDGSVETKLWSGPSLKREYEIVLGDKFKVEYAFCLNVYFEEKMMNSTHKKFSTLNTILKESNIRVLFGDDNNYFEMLDNWITN